MWKVNTRDWGRNHRTGEEKKQMGENATSLELLLQGKNMPTNPKHQGDMKSTVVHLGTHCAILKI